MLYYIDGISLDDVLLQQVHRQYNVALVLYEVKGLAGRLTIATPVVIHQPGGPTSRSPMLANLCTLNTIKSYT